MRCKICSSDNTRIALHNQQGYIEGNIFAVYACDTCATQFVDASGTDLGSIYETIYTHPDTPSYERYYRYAQKMKKETDPLAFLSHAESAFSVLPMYTAEKEKLSILDIGCGYGYISYALRKQGHAVTGIDISSQAIAFAQKQFGGSFIQADSATFSKTSTKKFDLITATEIIEHLEDPHAFLSDCMQLLKDDGKIIITTPNKGYYRNSAVWQTDLPPVHAFWFERKSFAYLAQKNGLQVTFPNMTPHSFGANNNLTDYIITRKEKKIAPALTSEGTPYPSRVLERSSFFRKLARFVMIDIVPIRYICNMLHAAYIRDYPALVVVLEKNNTR